MERLRDGHLMIDMIYMSDPMIDYMFVDCAKICTRIGARALKLFFRRKQIFFPHHQQRNVYRRRIFFYT